MVLPALRCLVFPTLEMSSDNWEVLLTTNDGALWMQMCIVALTKAPSLESSGWQGSKF